MEEEFQGRVQGDGCYGCEDEEAGLVVLENDVYVRIGTEEVFDYEITVQI